MFALNIVFFITLSKHGTLKKRRRMDMYGWEEEQNGIKQEMQFML
jgi:hypothetical protein